MKSPLQSACPAVGAGCQGDHSPTGSARPVLAAPGSSSSRSAEWRGGQVSGCSAFLPRGRAALGPHQFLESCLSQPPALSSLQSDSGYDFLSAEEKECLLFLEETIGSLDTEADSGLSTDESEQATTPRGPRALPTTQPAPQGKTDCLKNQKNTTSSWPLSLLSALCSESWAEEGTSTLLSTWG